MILSLEVAGSPLSLEVPALDPKDETQMAGTYVVVNETQYDTDTDAEISEAAAALASAGLESAKVWTGDSGVGEGVTSGRVLWAQPRSITLSAEESATWAAGGPDADDLSTQIRRRGQAAARVHGTCEVYDTDGITLRAYARQAE